jgi:hypothetical protein
LIIERKGYGQKNDGAKNGQYFSPIIFLPENCRLLERGTDVALAGILGLSIAAGRYCFSLSPVVGHSESTRRPESLGTRIFPLGPEKLDTA